MSDLIAEMRQDVLDRLRARLDNRLRLLESPIEQVMLLAWMAAGFEMDLVTGNWAPLMRTRSEVNFGLRCGFSFVAPQLTVETDGGEYRLDYALGIIKNGGDGMVFIDVECDGHEYHERTKAQAQRDKKRDRDLQANGWHVARFTGSEIWRSPEAVIRSVSEFAKSFDAIVEWPRLETLGDFLPLLEKASEEAAAKKGKP